VIAHTPIWSTLDLLYGGLSGILCSDLKFDPSSNFDYLSSTSVCNLAQMFTTSSTIPPAECYNDESNSAIEKLGHHCPAKYGM
jgi:hypothetical protein